jgi:hypothetical protein
MGRAGIEPATLGLKVLQMTRYANLKNAVSTSQPSRFHEALEAGAPRSNNASSTVTCAKSAVVFVTGTLWRFRSVPGWCVRGVLKAGARIRR